MIEYFNTLRWGIDITLSIFAVFTVAMIALVKIILHERNYHKPHERGK